jgi:Kef-type K+ transport system membrane component KefB
MSILPLRDVPELGGRDPIDAQLGPAAVSPAHPRRARLLHARLALGLSPTPVPGLVLLPLGIALGPHGIGVLSTNTLSYLDPAMSVALTALGVFIGLGLVLRRPRENRLVASASVEALVTMLVVGAGLYGARALVWPDLGGPLWFIIAALAICASASSTASSPEHGTMSALAARIGDLDDVLPVILGGLALAFMRESAAVPALWLFSQSVAVALVVAVAGWLLVSDVASDSEQRVFALGALLLLAGVAEYLALSALMAGFVAGLFWNAAAPRVRDRIARDVRHVQHPLVVLLLLVAGARVEVSPAVASLTVGYVLFRITGKIAGGWVAARVAQLPARSSLGVYLLSPGVIGIAFALNALSAGQGDAGTRVLTAVVFGSIASELLSLFVHPPEGER